MRRNHGGSHSVAIHPQFHTSVRRVRVPSPPSAYSARTLPSSRSMTTWANKACDVCITEIVRRRLDEIGSASYRPRRRLYVLVQSGPESDLQPVTGESKQV